MCQSHLLLLIQGNLTKDPQADLRVLTVNYTRENMFNYTTFEWVGKETSLLVNVDWMQEGG